MELKGCSFDKWDAVHVDFNATGLKERQTFVHSLCKRLAVADAQSLVVLPMVDKEFAIFYKKKHGTLDLNE